uniref:Sushi domain-containing protein n=1 Tax=Monopterus albus TaxID=43700 RepID=A0A3Q3J8J1_MONAL|nr:uncharacterized protein LOC109960894 isoform X1 [Monopterus albus]
MDSASVSFSVTVIMVCLLGAAHGSNGDKNSSLCPEIPQRNQTEDPPKIPRKVNEIFRYTCIEGYVRKVGTSNLIKCKLSQGRLQWSQYNLECILNPNLPTQQPKSTRTTPSTSIRMILEGSMSASVAPQTERTELTSPSVQSTSDSPQASISTTTKPVSGTFDAEKSAQFRLTTAVVIVSILLVIVGALFGITFYCRRRSRNNFPLPSREEVTPMNCVLSGQA